MGKKLRSFIVGSSFVVTVLPLGTLATAAHGKPPDVLHWPVVFIFFSLTFGLANVLTVALVARPSRRGFALAGAVLGVCLSATGTFGYNIPEVIYGLTGKTRYLALLLGPLLYGLIWSLVMYPIDRGFGLLDDPSSASGGA